jgi:SAM-dependent methyltransferase
VAEKPLQDLISRLETERIDADRRYNDALTALDAAARALSAPAPAAPPAVPYDPSQLPRVNDNWKIAREDVVGGPKRFVWNVVAPAIERQQAFNAALVDHLNRNIGAHADAAQAVSELRATIAADRASRAAFDSALIVFLQTITEYIDTKDRALGGPELREQIVLANERALALKREFDGLRAQDSGLKAAGSPPSALRPEPTDFSYVGFEDRFRGSEGEIRTRVADYVPLFQGGVAGAVLDVGCGRGELLALLKEAGIDARGIDVNAEMVALCRERGLEADQSDGVAFLQTLPDGSLAGLTAIQVVEHLEPAYLTRFLETAFHKMRPGATLVLETINPACWMAFFEAYIRDLTHAQPIHPDTLRFLVQASGFSSVDVQFRSPVADADRLETVNRPDIAEPVALREAIDALNAHADKLNARLFSYMDYAVVAKR